MVIIGIAVVVAILFFLKGDPPPRRRKYPPQYFLPNADTNTLPTTQADASSFADLFNPIIDQDGEAFFKTQRLKEDLERITAEAKLASTEAAVGARLNDLDKKQNEVHANVNQSLAQIQQEKSALQERMLEVKTGAAQNAIQQQLIEISKREFALQKEGFSQYIETKFHELITKQKELETAKYFYEKYKTLDAERIKLVYDRNQLEMQKDEANIRAMYQELDLREQRANMRVEAAKLMVEEKHLALNTEEYRYLEKRAIRQMGYKSFDAYFADWAKMDSLAREKGYVSAAHFANRMLGDRYQ
jgi:hypothetical protein